MARPTSSPRAQLWIVALLAALAAIGWDVRARLAHGDHVRTLASHLAPAPAADPDSPTGYIFGQRSTVLSDSGADGYHWIMQTQQMFAEGEPRVRRVAYDNAPRGREVHWASLFRWWLGGLAWIDHALNGTSLGIAAERAAVVASPLLLAVALPALAWLVARSLGSGAACGLIAMFVAGRACYAYFLTGNPDHHGIAIFAACVSVFALVAGGAGVLASEQQPPSETAPKHRGVAETVARRWFRVSAIAGAVGLWNSASTQIQVLVGIGLGAVLALVLARRAAHADTIRVAPELWRTWGLWGCGSSLLAYAIEYLPSEASMRLEVNHPLYALAWLGAGEVLCRLAHALLATNSRGRAHHGRIALAAGALVSLPAVVMAIGGRDVFVVLDRFYTALSVAFTSEGQSAWHHLQAGSLGRIVVVMALPTLLALPLAAATLSRQLDPSRRVQLTLALLPALVLAAWGLAEIRWLGIAVAVLPIAWGVGLQARSPAWLRRTLLAGLVLLVPGFHATFAYSPQDFTRPELYRVVERDIAHMLRRRTGPDPLVVAAGPGRSSSFIFFGGARGLGTFYWENRAGIEVAAELFRATDETTVREVLQARGITHVVLTSWDRFDQMVRSVDATLGRTSRDEPVLTRLARTRIFPAWLRPVPYSLLKHDLLDQESVLILEFDPEAQPADGPNRLAQFLLEAGQLEAALRLRPALERTPVHLPALITLASIQQEAQRSQEALVTLDRIADTFARQPELAPDDHLRLAGVLARARQPTAARAELQRALQSLDARALRRLTPLSVRELVILADALRVDYPDPALRTLALELAPGALTGP